MRATRRGFTLIELLIVVVVVGILAVITVQQVSSNKKKAYTAAMKSDLRNLMAAEEAFFADSGYYHAYQRTSSAGDTLLKFQPTAGVSDPSVTTGSGYWAARVWHTQITTGYKCGIGVGATNPVVTAAGNGEPACQ